jgi:peptidoglycan/LPS O-acetylase OafA/YrhL
MINHKPQLDALRAFAVLSVVVHHSWPSLQSLGLGEQGVKLFFVISGYLITNILLGCRFRIDNEPDRHSPGLMIRQFYARRFLRIFPAYYALLVPIGLFAMTRPTGSAWIESFKFHASYTSNFWFGLNGNWSPWATGHFWSLAVEEQFYLFWPMLMLWLPRKYLWSAAILLTISGPVFRWVMLALGANSLGIYVLTPACFDALGFGALLALGSNMPRAQAAIRLLGLGSFLLLMAISLASWFFDSPLLTEYLQRVLIPLLWALALAALVSKTAEGFTGPVGAVFTFTPVRYVGRISYGVYLYHLPILFMIVTALEQVGLSSNGPMRLAFGGSISLMIAAFSWRFFEEPINRLKRLFPYQAPDRTVAVSGSIAAAAPSS